MVLRWQQNQPCDPGYNKMWATNAHFLDSLAVQHNFHYHIIKLHSNPYLTNLNLISGKRIWRATELGSIQCYLTITRKLFQLKPKENFSGLSDWRKIWDKKEIPNYICLPGVEKRYEEQRACQTLERRVAGPHPGGGQSPVNTVHLSSTKPSCSHSTNQ